jgi:hypothetical protein
MHACDGRYIAMRTIWEGHLSGAFQGYQPGRLYWLTGGTFVVQSSRTVEIVCQDRPWASLWCDDRTGDLYLDVAGTSGCVLVRRCEGSTTNRAGRARAGGAGPLA